RCSGFDQELHGRPIVEKPCLSQKCASSRTGRLFRGLFALAAGFAGLYPLPTMAKKHILPDRLRPGLKLVFCGTAAGRQSALQQAYYAHGQNKFWKTLHRVGLTPQLFLPQDYEKLWDLG